MNMGFRVIEARRNLAHDLQLFVVVKLGESRGIPDGGQLEHRPGSHASARVQAPHGAATGHLAAFNPSRRRVVPAAR
jgi:hypothetical protein